MVLGRRLFLVCGALSCGRLSLSSATPRAQYERVYRRWTRHDEDFAGFKLALEVWATLKSWEFRHAFAERYAEVYRLTRPERESLLRAERAAAEEGLEFHVTAQSYDWQKTDLADLDSPWRVRLVDAAGRPRDPSSIRRLEDRTLDQFYSDRTAFSRSYAIRFPHAGRASAQRRAGMLRLLFLSPQGRTELSWRIPDADDPALS